MNRADTTDACGFRSDLPRWRQLVSAQWLAGLTAGAGITAPPAGHWRLLEIGFDGMAAYLQAHIPGASYLDTTGFECPPLWNKVPDSALLHLLLRSGIRHDTTVVLYARHPVAAARAAHLMLYAGVEDVRLLDGGYAAWTRLHLPVEQGLPPPLPAARDFGIPFPAHPEYLVDMRQARALHDLPDACLVSIRTWNEFIGKTSGYAYIPAKGDIAGARWGRSGIDGDVNSMSALQDAQGRMLAASIICRMWDAEGIRPDRHAVFYCGTGWRASLAFFYAWLMNWERIAVFDGGWLEWSRDPSNPVVRRVDASYERFKTTLEDAPSGSRVPCSPIPDPVRD